MQILSSYDYYHIRAIWNQNSRENMGPFDAFGISAIIKESGEYLDAESLCWLGISPSYEDAVLILHKLLDKYLQVHKIGNYYVVVANVHE